MNANTYQYVSSPAEAITTRAKQDSTTVTISATDTSTQAASAAQNADVAIVFITADSGEEYVTVEGHKGDRNNLDAWHNGEALVKAVANVNKNTIVVVHSTGPILMEGFADLANVKAIVWAGLPGQEAGSALADVLYGDVSPSGKMPYSIAKKASDYGTTIQSNTDNFGEGLYIDYRAFDKKSIVLRYEFGFGLCKDSLFTEVAEADERIAYTTFNYSNLAIAGSPTPGPETGDTIPGGASSLFKTAATVTATITNSGSVVAAEVAQLYLGFPDSAPDTPVRQLRGFEKLNINPGESKSVKFVLRNKDLSYWDATAKKWVVPKGAFAVDVGASSRDLRLNGKISVS